jgi:phosphate starvation-inducible PhoH-like protein
MNGAKVIWRQSKLTPKLLRKDPSNTKTIKADKSVVSYEPKVAVKPANKNQKRAMAALSTPETSAVILAGSAGTGKSYLALWAGLKGVHQGLYEKVVVIRSTVEVRSMGFLPGSIGSKLGPYEAPYRGICEALYDNVSAWNILKKAKVVEFISSAFLRGISLHNCYVILDEAQSSSWHEIDTVMTRIGDNTKIVVCGDSKQDDLTVSKNDRSGFTTLLKVSKAIEGFARVKFTAADVLRSGFTKDWLTACEEVGV